MLKIEVEKFLKVKSRLLSWAGERTGYPSPSSDVLARLNETDRRLVDELLTLGTFESKLYLLHALLLLRVDSCDPAPLLFFFLVLSHLLLELIDALLHANLAQLLVVSLFGVDVFEAFEDQALGFPDHRCLLIRHRLIALRERQRLQLLKPVLSGLVLVCRPSAGALAADAGSQLGHGLEHLQLAIQHCQVDILDHTRELQLSRMTYPVVVAAGVS